MADDIIFMEHEENESENDKEIKKTLEALYSMPKQVLWEKSREKSIHDTFNQIKRRRKSLDMSENDVLYFNGEKNLMAYNGSGAEPYTTTLFMCSCFDFESTKMPCKHIYFLARKVGVLEELPKCVGKQKSKFDMSAEEERYKKMMFDGDISVDDYIGIGNAINKVKFKNKK